MDSLRVFAPTRKLTSLLENTANLARVLQTPRAWEVTTLVIKLVVRDRGSCPLRDSDSISGKGKGLGDLATRRGNGSLPLGVPTHRWPERSWQLLPASAPPPVSGQVHRFVPAPLPARRARPPPWTCALLLVLQETVRARPVSAWPSCPEVFPSATAPFPRGLGRPDQGVAAVRVGRGIGARGQPARCHWPGPGNR